MTRVVTNKFRVSFAKVFMPDPDNGKYSITMLFDSKEDLNPLKQAIRELAEENGITDLKKYQLPFKDGNEKADADDKYENFRGKHYLQANTKFEPGIVDQARNPIIDRNEFYSGCFARASVSPYFWEYNKKKGIGFNLFNVQKMEDGERFGGGASVNDDFDEVASETNTEDFDI